MRRWGAVLALFLCATCELFPDLGGLVDGGAVDAPDAPDHGFALSAAPAFVTMDPGDAPITIGITAARAGGFTDAIALAVSGGVGTISAPAAIAQGGVSSSLTISIDAATTARGDFTFEITGTSGAFVAQTSFVLHIGSLLAPNDAGVIVVPQGAHAIVVKAWGAGGGCGAYGGGNCEAGTTFGGGGGYASATFDVTGGTSFVVIPGSGGASSTVSYAGGGGGGFSGVRAGTDWILIAGGGGGGGGAVANGNGGSGGGLAGHAGPAKCSGSGGTQTSGGAGECSDAGAVLGAALQGGGGQDEKSAPAASGGAPGGGAGGTGGFGSGGGGGGGGWFGGGGGTINDCTDNSGGGGSAHVSDAGRDSMFADTDAATPAAANTTDGDYTAGLAIGCNVFTKKGTGGSAGLVVVRLVKP